MRMPVEKIPAFRDEFGFLSNMYLLKNKVDYNGIWFPSTEHAFVASKTDDTNIHMYISTIYRPSESKHYGKTLKLRDNWHDLQTDIMMELVYKKFLYNSDIAVKLLEIEGEIVERNYWKDTFWGVCNGVGENWLGRILMGVRGTLKQEQNTDK